MKIIKLDTVDSTNSFLKDMAVNTTVENYTVVVAKEQTKGRGQMQSKWIVDAGKNLTFSVLLVFDELSVENKKYLNFAVCVSVFETLKEFNVPKLSIKWPNDILSGKHKICGILIENIFRGNAISQSVIGIGVNVNQEIFPSSLKYASSIKNILHKETDLGNLLNHILKNIKKNIQLLNEKQYQILETKYLDVLYKRRVPSMFKDKNNNLFMGKIVGVSNNGKLQMELEDETIQEFGIKEVSFVY
ncbi:MAG: biotin--[acetyl-CoA-carboxylase] ligase [Tenacibaculum sp.]|nr:biotin--[acetyl-CoA-carboxylase] ligase [Tenacibaculum sp.]